MFHTKRLNRTFVESLLFVSAFAAGSRAQNLEFNTALMKATVRLDGSSPNGAVVGTGFILRQPVAGPGEERLILVSANHVFEGMSSHVVNLSTRHESPNGTWNRLDVRIQIRHMSRLFDVEDVHKSPLAIGDRLAILDNAERLELELKSKSLGGICEAVQKLKRSIECSIQGRRGAFELSLFSTLPYHSGPIQLIAISDLPRPLLAEKRLWTKHTEADVAVLSIALPTLPQSGAVSGKFLADDEMLAAYGLHAGDELNCLGYPLGAEGPLVGFPILRSGKIASFPLIPTRQYKTFFMDFQVFGGNSGGPVYVANDGARTTGSSVTVGRKWNFIVGLVSQQLLIPEKREGVFETTERRYPLGIAAVVPASLIVETIKLLPSQN